MRDSMVLYQGTHAKVTVVTVCRDIADSLDEGVRTDVIIIHFSKAFDLVHMTGYIRNSRQSEWI
jgi:hypothetical protein